MEMTSNEARERADGRDRWTGESVPLELARRAIAAQRGPEPEPLNDPWFIDEEPVEVSREDPSYESWVDNMESWVPRPPGLPARITSQIAALFFL
jgi:hypothetical protein